jgi:hypothetical protein
MRTDRRLDQLEGAMTPTQAARYWLEERQAFDSPAEYLEWLADQALGTSDLDRVMARARAGARMASSGEPRSLVAAAEQRAARDALFRVQFVLTLQATAADAARMELLRSEKLIWQLRALNAEWTLGLATAADAELAAQAARWHVWPLAMQEHLLALYVEAEARALLERRYLEGDTSLFGETDDRLDRLVASAEDIAACWTELRAPSLQHPVAGRSDIPVLPILDLESLRQSAGAQAEIRAAELSEDARVATLSILGESSEAMAITRSRADVC